MAEVARRAFAEKFGFGRKSLAPRYAILSRYLDLSRITHFFGYFVKKRTVLVKNSVFGQEVHYYTIYIAYFTKLNWQIYIYAQKRRILRTSILKK